MTIRTVFACLFCAASLTAQDSKIPASSTGADGARVPLTSSEVLGFANKRTIGETQTGRDPKREHLLKAFANQPMMVPDPLYGKMVAPEGAQFILFGQDGSEMPQPNTTCVGLHAGCTHYFAVERLRRGEPGRYYGTIEIHRPPNPPVGVTADVVPFPIVVNEDDAVILSRGGMVTKLLVLEDPDTALPISTKIDEPLRYDATYSEDPVRFAKELGRISAVVRIGNRVPMREEFARQALGAWVVPERYPVDHPKPTPGSGILPVGYIYADNASHTPSKEMAVSLVQAEQAIRGPLMPNIPRANDPRKQAGNPQGMTGMSGQGFVQHSTSFKRPALPNQQESCCAPGAIQSPWLAGGANGCFTGTPAQVPPARLDNRGLPFDEYLCDGGDRALLAKVDSKGRIINIDPEDTIAIYSNKRKENVITKSNRVCIYSPRYVEVAFYQGIEAYAGAANTGRIEQDEKLYQAKRRQGFVEYTGPQAVQAQKQRRAASLIRMKEGTDAISEVRILEGFHVKASLEEAVDVDSINKVHNSFELNQYTKLDIPSLMQTERAAQIIATDEGTGELVGGFGLGEQTGLQLKPQKSCLILEKSVSKRFAQVGDIIEFTIKFRNSNGEKLTNVSVVDCLSTRFEYVPNSAQGPKGAVFTAQINADGCDVLRWELKEPLGPEQSGQVTFKAVVR